MNFFSYAFIRIRIYCQQFNNIAAKINSYDTIIHDHYFLMAQKEFNRPNRINRKFEVVAN